MLRTELAELVAHGFQAHGIELDFEAKMADTAFELEYLRFGVGQYGGKEMGGLRGQGGLTTHIAREGRIRVGDVVRIVPPTGDAAGCPRQPLMA